MNAPQQPAPEGKQRIIKIEGQMANPYQANKMPKEGDRIGPNKVMCAIGEGGNAAVYKVWNEGLEVVRAMKVLKATGNKEASERFITEAKILADISHPNIVEIHNLGYWEQQIPFIDMEFVDGMSVKQIITDNTRIALPAALAITYFVCHALQYAHTKDYTLYGNVYHGLIHRDIKPDNIVISKDGRVKLMDFGIARPSEVSLHTVGAKIMGTLVYLSPEQLSGSALDNRSDLFSLGAVLYEMITGERVYPQKTLAELVQKKTKGQYRSIESFGLDLPPALPPIVTKSMALNAADRYQSAADFGHDVYALLREISDRAPAEVVAQYIRDPASVTVVKRAKPLPVPLIIAVVAAATAVLMSIVGYFLLR
jgi:eukaryotic-like serine/threonine-protein kinase